MTQHTLTLEDIAPYLFSGLKFMWDDTKVIYGITLYEQTDYCDMLYPLATIAHTIVCQPEPIGYKILLRPLSQLTQPIEHRGETFVPSTRLIKEYDGHDTSLWNPSFLEARLGKEIASGIMGWKAVNKIHSWMFDTSGLIEKGLAIDITTLTENPYK